MVNREISANDGQDLTDENVAIYGILVKILKGLQPETQEKKVDLEEDETVTLSLKDLKKEAHSKTEEIGETVILSRKDLTKGPLPEKKERELDEAVIHAPDSSNKGPVSEKPEKPQDILSETVIISPQTADDETLTSSPQVQSEDVGDKDNFECDKTEVKKPEKSEFLTETVILKPGKAQGKDRDGGTA